MRSEFAVLIIIAFSATALGGAYLVTQGGAFSKSEYEWRIDIAPRAAGAWSVEVPRLVGGPNASRDDDASLSRLLQELRKESGTAQFQLQVETLRIVGDGNATILASRTSARGDESFLDWMDTGRTVSRRDDGGGPTIRVTWSVSFSPGGGRDCQAKGSNTIEVPSGEIRTFPEPIGRGVGGGDDEPRGDRPPEPLWRQVCV